MKNIVKKNMILILVASSFLFFANCSNQKIKDVEIINCPPEGLWEKEGITFEFEEVLEICENDSNQYYFSGYHLSGIVSNEAGKIFIANTKDKCIYKFSLEGKFIKTIGRKGKGPGEFEDIAYLTIDLNNHLAVYDGTLRRVVVYNDNETVESHIKINDAYQSSSGGDVPIIFNETGFLLFGISWDYKKMFNFFDFDGNPVKSFGEYQFVDNIDFEKTGVFNKGAICVCQGRIFYSNEYYNNRIYIYQDSKLDKIIQTKTFFEKPYTVQKASSDKELLNKRKPGDFIVSRKDQSYLVSAKINSEHIFKLKNDMIMNFVVETDMKTKSSIKGFELFDSQYQYLGYFIYAKANANSTSCFKIMSKDKDDNFYATKRDRKTGAVSIVKLRLKKNDSSQ